MITARINAINLRIHQIYLEATDDKKARIFEKEIESLENELYDLRVLITEPVYMLEYKHKEGRDIKYELIDPCIRLRHNHIVKLEIITKSMSNLYGEEFDKKEARCKIIAETISEYNTICSYNDGGGRKLN
jgi:predicted nucleic-acid-binding protein